MDTLKDVDYVAFIGIDWATAKHDVCIQEADSEQREFAIIPHQVELIDEWALSLRQRFGSPIAVAVELTKGPIVSALQKYDFFDIYPVNPTTLAKYREAFTPSRAKQTYIQSLKLRISLSLIGKICISTIIGNHLEIELEFTFINIASIHIE